jgi:hypothetical protein
MTIRHKKVVVRPDGADPTQVQPSDWNDDHEIVDFVGMPIVNAIPTPDADHVAMFAWNNGGYPTLMARASGRPAFAVQPHFGFRSVRWAQAFGNGNSINAINLGNQTVGNAFTINIASGSLLAATPRRGFATGTAADSGAGWRSNSLMNFRDGGFFASFRFSLDVSPLGSRGLVAMRNSTDVFSANTEPSSTTVATLGVSFDSTDSGLSFIRRGTSAAVVTPSTIARNQTSLYELLVFAPANEDRVVLTLRDLSLGLEDSQEFTDNLPGASVGLAPHFHIANGATGADCRLGFATFYVESEV